MIKLILAVLVLVALSLASCTNANKQESTNTTNEITNASADSIKSSYIDKSGRKLEIITLDKENTATILFEGQTIELVGYPVGSGYGFENEQYDLRGKGNNLHLTKDGRIIFEHEENTE